MSMELTPVILDEVLCFLFNQHDVIPQSDLAKICSENFEHKAILNAKAKLFSLVQSTRMSKKHKAEDNVTDMISLLNSKELLDDVELPIFAASDLSKIPSVAPFHVDSSQMIVCMRRLQADLDQANAYMKDFKLFEQELTSVKAELANVSKLHSEFNLLRTEFDIVNTTLKHVQSVGTKSYNEVVKVSQLTVSDAAKQPATPLRGQIPGPAESPSVEGRSSPRAVGPQPDVADDPERDPAVGGVKFSQASLLPSKVPLTGPPGASVKQPTRQQEIGNLPGKTDTHVRHQPTRSNGAGIRSARDDGWQVVKTRRSQATIGSKLHGRLKCIAPRPRKASVFLSRLAPDTTCRDVVEFVNDSFSRNADVIQLKTKYPDTYASFKVSVNVDSDSIEKIISPELWPEGALVRRFFEPRNFS